MKSAWIVASLVLLAIFVVGLVSARAYVMFDALGPGPGFFPFWLSVFGLALSGLLLLETALARSSGPIEIPESWRAMTRPVAVLVALAIVAGLLEVLGYRITAFIFITGLLVALGARPLWVTLVMALAGSWGVFHVFYFWLKVPLPYGVFGI